METHIGGLLGSAPKPPAVPTPPPAAAPATIANPQVADSAANQRMKAAASYNASGTIGTNPEGLQAPSTAQSTLLGGTK